MPDSTPEPPPTVTEIRDHISWFSPSGFERRKKVGDDRLVIFHPSGAKYEVKVTKVDG